jgi:hypothetical protein
MPRTGISFRDAAPSGRWTAPQNSAGGKMLRRAPLPFPQQTSTGIVYASFYAPDSATAIVDADTGQSWTQLAGTWGTHKYRAYMSAPNPNDGNCAAVVETGVSNAKISVQVNDPNSVSAQGILFARAMPTTFSSRAGSPAR